MHVLADTHELYFQPPLQNTRTHTQPSNAYAGDEDVPRSACEGLLTFLERHLEPLWARLGVEGEMGAGGEIVGCDWPTPFAYTHDGPTDRTDHPFLPSHKPK